MRVVVIVSRDGQRIPLYETETSIESAALAYSTAIKTLCCCGASGVVEQLFFARHWLLDALKTEVIDGKVIEATD